LYNYYSVDDVANFLSARLGPCLVYFHWSRSGTLLLVFLLLDLIPVTIDCVKSLSHSCA